MATIPYNITSVFDLFKADLEVNSWFWVGILIMIYFIILIINSYKLDIEKNMLVTNTLCLILAIFLLYAELINYLVFAALIGIEIILILITYYLKPEF